MGTTPYVALLRGINVGGRNKIAMADLRATFEAGGYEAVRTYIQSGNVLFGSGAPPDSLEADLEAMLKHRFGYPLSSWCGRTSNSARSSKRRLTGSARTLRPTTRM